MPYIIQNWINLPVQETPINAERLMHMEQGIYEASLIVSNLPNFDEFATVDELPDLTPLALKSEIPDISGLATKAEVSNKVTMGQVQDAINNIPPVNLSAYATQNWVTNAINQAVIDGSDDPVDLSPYALKVELDSKVDKEAGKGLSTNDFTSTLKEKLEGLENFNPSAITTALASKVDTVAGKQLSTNDYTDLEKNKLAGIESGAQKNPDMSLYATNAALTSVSNATTKTYTSTGLVVSPKRFVGTATANSEGFWTINYESVGFTKIHSAQCSAMATGSNTTNRRLACFSQGYPTLTQANGAMMGADSAGLVVSTLVAASGTVHITIDGE